MTLAAKKDKPCKFCGGFGHTAFACYKRPSKRLRKESKRAMELRVKTREEWFELNPPDEFGEWECYLKIAPDCPMRLTRKTLRLEHYYSKARRPDLKYDVNNIRPACDPCNKLKASANGSELVRVNLIDGEVEVKYVRD